MSQSTTRPRAPVNHGGLTRRKLLGIIPLPVLAAASRPRPPAPPNFDRPQVLELVRPQPVPIRTRAVRHQTPSGDWVTTIDRTWRDGDAARCTLCPAGTCCAEGDQCLMTIDGFVGPERTSLFSPAAVPGFTWREREEGDPR